MRMGDHEAGQISPHFFDEAYVRNDEVYPRKIRARESHPAIDHQPFQLPLAAKAIQREVHADFAQASKRHKDELVISVVHLHEPFLDHNGTIQPAQTGSSPSAFCL